MRTHEQLLHFERDWNVLRVHWRALWDTHLAAIDPAERWAEIEDALDLLLQDAELKHALLNAHEAGEQ